MRSKPPESFPWSIIDKPCIILKLFFCCIFKICFLWNELPEKSVGIFIDSSLPGMVWMSKEYGHFCLKLNHSMLTKLHAIVIGDREFFMCWNGCIAK